MWLVWGWLPCLRLPRLGTGSAKWVCSLEGKQGRGTTSQLTSLTSNDNSGLTSRPGWSESPERKDLLTEWALWCLKHTGPNQVLPPVHCGSAFCTHWEKEIVCHSDGGCLENPVFTLQCAENTRRTYISLRCCSLENKVPSSTCNLLWLRSLQREKKGKIKGKVYTVDCVSQLLQSSIWAYIANIITWKSSVLLSLDTVNRGSASKKRHCN